MGKKIMIVDDSSVIRKSVVYAVEQSGYTTSEAVNGQDALDRLQEIQPDLIICDVNMPVMDGITMLKTIKNDKAYSSFRYIPILMLTTETSRSMAEDAKKDGARTWLQKPFHPEKLISSVKMLIG